MAPQETTAFTGDLEGVKSLTQSSAAQLVPAPRHLRVGRFLGLGAARGPAVAYQLAGADFLTAAGWHQKDVGTLRG